MSAAAPSFGPVSQLLKRADLIFTGGLFLTILLLIMPIPAIVLDLMLALNLGLSILVLLARVFRVSDPAAGAYFV
jgi:flagellar biosynthesis protein FlhA